MPTISITADQCQMVEELLVGELGYTNGELDCVLLYPDGDISWQVRHTDDFQQNLDYALKQSHSYCETYSVKTFASLMTELRRLPNREMRELAVMAARIGNLGDTSQLESARAQAFAKRMMEEHQTLLKAIQHKPSVTVDHVADDEELL